MAGNNVCPTCFDHKGLCDGRDRKKSFFVLTLQEGFGERTLIPCYTRAYFLQKYDIAMFQHCTFGVDLITKEGFSFSVEVKNRDGQTYIKGRIWKEFARVYDFKVGQDLIFSIGTHESQTDVTPRTYPLIHPSYYHISKAKREIVDSLVATHATKINWRMMETVINHIDMVDMVVENHAHGDFTQETIVPMIHTLNWTNSLNYNKHLKIPRRLLPQGMAKFGSITLVCHPYTKVSGTYAIFADDGRMCVSGWKEFMEKEHFLVMDDKLLLLMYIGIAGVFLFVSYVPNVALE